MPDECLKHADMICLDEGEDLVVELADRLRTHHENIPGLRTSQGPPVMPAPQFDLSRMPTLDYAFDGSHYFVSSQGAHARGATCIDSPRVYNGLLGEEYLFTLTRGYMYKCTYCVNSRYAQLYDEARCRGQKFKRLRVRAPDSLIWELIWTKNHFSPPYSMEADDYVTGLKIDEIRYFAAA